MATMTEAVLVSYLVHWNLIMQSLSVFPVTGLGVVSQCRYDIGW